MSYPLLFYFLLVLCLLLAVALTAAAVRRTNRQRLVPRLLAGWLAGLALWLIVYPPRYQVQQAQLAAVVLTPGYQPDTLRQLLRQLGPATTMWRYGFSHPSDTPSLGSLLLLREQQPALRRLHVLGRGLPATELANRGPLQLKVHDAAPVAGFGPATWQHSVELGQPVVVAGTLAAAAPAPVWVSLRGPGHATDSVLLQAGRGSFQLRYAPKAAGLAVYQLVARRGSQTVATEPVPVETTTPQPLRIVLLSSTASFEFKFLKNYLGAQRHHVALRTGLSRGIIQTEFLNHSSHDLSRLTPTLLARNDVVVADAGALAALSATEKQAVNAAVRTAGLGLIVLADPAPLPPAVPARSSFAIVPRLAAATDRPQPVRWGSAAASALLPATLRLGATARSLVAAGREQPVVGTQRLGLGSVTVSVLSQTYPWILQNMSGTYAAYWSHLLRAAARPLPTQARWQVLSATPRPHEPVQLRLASSEFPAAQPTVAGPDRLPVARLALQQDAHVLEWKTGQFWPGRAGWHRVQLAGQPPHDFYVFAPTDWQGAQQQALLAAEAARQAPASFAPAPTDTATRPYPVAWFFALFLLAAGFLWLEEKL